MGKTPDAKVITIAGSEESGFADDTGPKAKFWNPSDIVVDSDGNCYVQIQIIIGYAKSIPKGRSQHWSVLKKVLWMGPQTWHVFQNLKA